MSILPKDFEGIPQGDTKYLKFEEGENIIRILSEVIVGYEYWIDDKDGNRKPVRVETWDEIPDAFKGNKDNRKNAKYFWGMVVYNVNIKNIQILEIKQKGIMRSIEALDKSKAWGDARDYDIIITKTKTGAEEKDVEYSVMPSPKEEVDEGIKKAYQDMDINLMALFKGEDPFKNEEVNVDDIPDFDVEKK